MNPQDDDDLLTVDLLTGDLPDGVLAARSQAGDRAALAALLLRHRQRLWSVALGLCRDPQEAAEILQETAISAMRGIGALEQPGRAAAWLARIALNHARMRLRRQQRSPIAPLRAHDLQNLSIEELPEHFLPDGHFRAPISGGPPDPEQELDRHRLAQALLEAETMLPDGHREVWRLADVEGFAMQEIAEMLDLSVPNVKTRLHRARLALRGHLARFHGSGA